MMLQYCAEPLVLSPAEAVRWIERPFDYAQGSRDTELGHTGSSPTK